MYAIVKISGEQIKIRPKERCYTALLPHKVGSKVTFDEVMLVEDDKGPSFGAPFIKGAKVIAKVLKHFKGDKVVIFKKKRRQGYRVKKGHRQDHTQILIETITKN